jgi:hypothetical protein
MVYRLVPSYRFRPQSRFGMEDMTKAPVVVGYMVGLVAGMVLSYVLAMQAMKADPTKGFYKAFVQLDDKGKKTVFKNWQFWLTAVGLCVVCAVTGGAIGASQLPAQ